LAFFLNVCLIAGSLAADSLTAGSLAAGSLAVDEVPFTLPYLVP
jgi:hypothetical protein